MYSKPLGKRSHAIRDFACNSRIGLHGHFSSKRLRYSRQPKYNLELASDSVCSPLSLIMPSIEGAQNMVWNFGDGSTSTETTPSHTWNNATGELMSATVTLQAETAMGCSGISQTTVHIKPQPIADFSVNYDEGCEPLVSAFTNLSALADTYDWDFGDGSTDHTLNPTHAFQTNGTESTFEVTLTAHDDLGCADSATQEVNVFPAAAFELGLVNRHGLLAIGAFYANHSRSSKRTVELRRWIHGRWPKCESRMDQLRR